MPTCGKRGGYLFNNKKVPPPYEQNELLLTELKEVEIIQTSELHFVCNHEGCTMMCVIDNLHSSMLVTHYTLI